LESLLLFLFLLLLLLLLLLKLFNAAERKITGGVVGNLECSFVRSVIIKKQ